MANYGGKSFQSGIKEYNSPNETYSMFLGGMNATSPSLDQFDPLRTGYGRIFFVKIPRFMFYLDKDQAKRVRHILEYGNTGFDGLGSTQLDFENMTGGYAGKEIPIPVSAKDDMTEFSLKLYEFSGSPIREFMELWITGISDPHTGLAHYHGAKDGNTRIPYRQSNHVAEAFYVVTGPSGHYDDIEYCCFLANIIPTSVDKSHFEYSAGDHSIVQITQSFKCVKYESRQINTVGKALLKKFVIMRDFIDFDSGWNPTTFKADGSGSLGEKNNNWSFGPTHKELIENDYEA